MCFDKRKPAVITLMVLSGLACLFGILMIVFSALLTNNAVLKQMGKDYKPLDDARKMVFLVLLIFSLVTIGIAAMGFCAKCVKNRCFYCFYGFILLPAFLLVVIFGIIGLAAGGAAKNYVDTTCQTIVNSAS